MNEFLSKYPGLQFWQNTGERGLSSDAIVTKLVYGETPRPYSHPYDPSDLRRCELLLQGVPSLRAELPRMAEVSPEWAALVPRWEELVETMGMENRTALTAHASGEAMKTYRIMSAILEQVRQERRAAQ